MTVVPLVVEPDPDEPGCATVLVDGTVAGHPHRFVLDTGAARTCVRSDPVTRTYPTLGDHTSSGVFASSTEDRVVLPELRVGPVGGTDVPALRIGADQAGARALLGMDLLRRHRLRLDLDGATLVVDPPGAPEDCRPLWMDAVGHPFVDVRWPGVVAHALWDTGAGTTVVDPTLVARHPALFTADGWSVGTDATGAQLRVPAAVVADAEVGGVRIAGHRVAVVDLGRVVADRPVEVVLGYPALRQAVWFLDLPGARWSARPA